MSAPTNFQVTGCNSFWKIHCFYFFLKKSLSYHIWPCRKIGQGQPRVTIYINFVELESPMLQAKFQDHRTSGSGREDFQRILPYMGLEAILVMWTASCDQIFISLYLKAFIQSLVQIGTVVSEKIQFEFLYVHDLGPRSRNDLDLQYSHIFIYSIKCLLQLTFRSLAAIVSEKPLFSLFPIYRKA